MKRVNRRWPALILVFSSTAGMQLSEAQEIARDATVANRARPELDALGVRSGSFLLYPELAVSAVRNDNIYADGIFVAPDTIFVVSPSVEFESNWNSHELNFGANADVFRYRNYKSESHEDYSIWAEGRLDTSREKFFVGEISRERLHEDRDSPDDVRASEPTRYYRDQMVIGYEAPRGPRRFHTQLTGEYRRLDFQDSVGEVGVIDQDDRDRRRLSGTARVGYGLRPEYSLFVQGSVHSETYDQQVDDGGFARSSTGYEISLGTTLDFFGKTFGDIFVGYLSETYDDPRFDKIDGPSFGAEVFWNVSGLTTISISGRREVEPSTIGSTAGVIATGFRLGADHELLRNLILSLGASAVKEDFEGTERRDDIHSLDFLARYMMGRRFELEFSYNYRRRDTAPASDVGIEFSRNIVSFTIKGHL